MRIIITAVCCLLICISCKKESFNTSPDAGLFISADSIKFDTVFTTAGSITQRIKIINTNDQKLMLSIKLAGGNTSPFHLNINGTVTNSLDVEVASNDSIYVFITVTINPTTGHLPFIVQDNIQISYNGITRNVPLIAYGQNARFIQNTVITGNEIWNNSLPYVISGGIRIDTTATLQIDQGTKVYLHGSAPFVVDGTLIINGTVTNPVTFRSDRLDEYYKDIPGSWAGINIRGASIDNQFTYAYLLNADQAINIQGPSLNSNPKLEIHQCIIDNAANAGILISNSMVNADNTLITNCKSNLKIVAGGSYNFVHCTLASYSNNFIYHLIPVADISNSALIDNVQVSNPLDATFTNCIFWGDNGITESEMNVTKDGNLPFNVILDHCLYKGESDPPNTTLLSLIRNQDPVFDSIDVSDSYYDFRISDPASPVIDQGVPTGFIKDLGDHVRTGTPDLGCFEKQ